MRSYHNLRMLIVIIPLSLILPASVTPGRVTDEKEELISQRDVYTYVLCYYADALDYAIANLHSEDEDSRQFAMDVASRIVGLHSLHGHEPSKEIELFAAFQRTNTSPHMKFTSAVAQARLGSARGSAVLLEEFRAKSFSYDSRVHALRVILEGDIQPYKSIFEQALTDQSEVGALAAVGLSRLGDPKGKQWLLDRIGRAHSRPRTHVLKAIQDVNLTEAIPLLRPWLTYAGSDEHELEATAKQVPIGTTMAILGDQTAKEFLRDILSRPEIRAVRVVGPAALCLAGLDDRKSIPAMKRALEIPTQPDWIDVMEALLILQDRDAVDRLLPEIDRRDVRGRRSADLAIKYKIAEARPALQARFDTRNRRDWWAERVFPGNDTPDWLKKLGVSKDDYVDGVYKDGFWECVHIALHILDVDPERGKANVLALLHRKDIARVERRSLERLLAGVAKRRITEALPILVQLLDAPDPSRRRAALECLRGLTGQDLPPIRAFWEGWIADSTR